MREHTSGSGSPRWLRCLRKVARHIGTGLMHVGAYTWMSVDMLAALRGRPAEPVDDPVADPVAGVPPEPAGERITPHAELPYAERRLFRRFEEQFRPEGER
ncbi:hypothetical protein Misp01_18890 [Microtetraspora sp. NBRC 13810]|uniref:hypothetical protein n=1 Tax=Microtetraspora sp. NBRC 13810 TaxID=3030990 RepID=UPI00249FABD2|nr:hypothetical protein [Microtetraspora sp. NBRC 13810]GLW06759.1 hypothetical protein Misp01_18890 [Microtetraspora sp. NBRC 13810]